MGVNLIGASGEHSIAVMTRDYEQALRAAGIPVTVHAVTPMATVGSARTLLGTRRMPRYPFTIIVFPPLFFDIASLPIAVTAGRYVIANWLWEQTELPPAYMDGTSHVNEIWASSAFVQSVFERSVDKPVTLIPHPVRDVGDHDSSADRPRFGIPDDRYVFLTIAAVSSSMVRKNPFGSLHAFRAAFPHGQTEAVLVIKLLANGFNPTEQDQRATFAADPAFGDDVILLVDAFTDPEMTSLVNCCDAFVSLHRAEGFGLGAAEAMSLEKPVIVTNWSGPVDYLTAENSLPVPYELVIVEDTGTPLYRPGLEWAEPDLDVATRHMRSLVDDPESGRVLGRRAAVDIATRHSTSAVGAVMAARLREIHGT